MNDEPLFHIYASAEDNRSEWLEAVPGLGNARERLEEIAREKPGRYFVLSPHSGATVAASDTRKQLQKAVLAKAKRAVA